MYLLIVFCCSQLWKRRILTSFVCIFSTTSQSSHLKTWKPERDESTLDFTFRDRFFSCWLRNVFLKSLVSLPMMKSWDVSFRAGSWWEGFASSLLMKTVQSFSETLMKETWAEWSVCLRKQEILLMFPLGAHLTSLLVRKLEENLISVSAKLCSAPVWIRRWRESGFSLPSHLTLTEKMPSRSSPGPE